MTLLITTLPDERAELAQTLERYLLSPDLDDLVGELTAIHGDRPTSITLAKLLHDDRGDLLMRGLSVLSNEKLRRLLRNPSLLIELHELVLIEGGSYWDRLLRQQDGLQRLVERAGQRLEVSLGLKKLPVFARPRERESSFYARPWFVSFATAAVLALGFVAFLGLRERLAETPNRQSEVAARSGWLKADTIPLDLSAPDYLDRLALLAEESQNQKTDTLESLSDHILSLRRGCAHLQLAKHPQLSPEQSRALLARCRKWAEKLNGQLEELETTRDVELVRLEVAETMQLAAKALREDANRIRKNET